MKIVFAGGGSGGHFYPVIAIVQELNKIIEKEKLVGPKFYFFSNDPYNASLLTENGIVFKKINAGKRRLYPSVLNFLDLFKTATGVLGAILKLYLVYPDVVFGKGGYASFPTLLAARFLKVPVIIHESDSTPGRVSLWAGKFAQRVAVSYPEAAAYFPPDKTAWTGNPVRSSIAYPVQEGAREYLKFEEQLPIILFLGGSQGAAAMNDTLVDVLPQLVERYGIIHQTGLGNYDDVRKRSEVVLSQSQFKDRYKIFPYLNELAIRMSAGVADLVISRAGSTIFEVAAWGLPSIIIPINSSQGDHQRKNAYNYAKHGAGVVIEEKNLSSHLLLSEINRVMADEAGRAKMAERARKFARLDAAAKLAQELIYLALRHER